jgi:phage terminase large subunit-like protein
LMLRHWLEPKNWCNSNPNLQLLWQRKPHKPL